MTSAREPDRPGSRAVRAGLAVVAIALVLGACAAGPGLASAADGGPQAGFWQGLWHGLISPVTFVVSLFTDSVSVYEIHNTGNWYDAGFMIGVSTVFSGSARSGVRASSRRSERRSSTGAAEAP